MGTGVSLGPQKPLVRTLKLEFYRILSVIVFNHL